MFNQDLYAKYLEFNKKYFDNKLPLDVKVVWDNRLVASAGSYNWSWGVVTRQSNFHLII